MKIGIICYPTYGGSGAVATSLGLELAERGHEVHFISYAEPFRLAGYRERVFFHEVDVEPYPLFDHPPLALALAAAIHDVAHRHGLDLVHVHYALPHATSAWMAQEMYAEHGRLPVVTTLHGTDITIVGQHPSLHSITRFSILRSDAVTAVSRFLARETEKNFNVSEERIEVIPNFVDTERYRREDKPCHRGALAPDGERILMHVSNFRPVKRVQDAVEVLARVLEGGVPSRLIFIGDGPERVRAENRAQELGVEDQVAFLGKSPSVDELLPCADLFLLPSESESFGLAALEAMACGVPVVASRVGGLPEVLEEGVSGFLAGVGETDAMAEAALSILKDEARWNAISRAARETAVERFSTDRIVPRYEALYQEVLDTASARTGGSS